MAGEWRTRPLTELYEFSSGLSKPSSEFGAGEGFLTFKDVLDHFFIPEMLSGLVNSTPAEQERCSIRRGDVFLTRTSETQPDLGMSCVALHDYPKATFNGFTKRLRPKVPDTVAPEYAAYYFRGPKFRQAVTSMSSLSTRASLNNEMLSRLTIDLPPIGEQRAIGIMLKAFDDKIELNRRRSRTLEAMARAIFQSWFVDFDPVRAKVAGQEPPGLTPALAALFPDRFEDTDLGPIPAGWRACRWGDIVTLEYGKSLRNYSTTEGAYRVYGTNGSIGWHRESLWNGPGVIVGRKGAYRGVHYSPHPFYVIDTAFFLSPRQPIDMKWAYYELLKCDINGMDSGSAIPSTSRADFYGMAVWLPTGPVLNAFGRIVQSLYEQKDAGDGQNATLSALRDALLPKLISGEIRVPDAERIVGRAT